jgi:hypothetical protein
MGDEDPLLGGTRLQLPVYRFAVPDAEEVQAFYWFISTATDFDRRYFNPSPQNMARFDDTLRAIIGGIRNGAFPPVPGDESTRPGWSFENCTFCDFDRLCATRRDDEFESKHEHAAVQPWARVQDIARGEPR